MVLIPGLVPAEEDVQDCGIVRNAGGEKVSQREAGVVGVVPVDQVQTTPVVSIHIFV